MYTPLHKELGIELPEEGACKPRYNNDAFFCSKCRGALCGVLTGRQETADGEFLFTVISYCPWCEKKPDCCKTQGK